jgi:hypothetical protein
MGDDKCGLQDCSASAVEKEKKIYQLFSLHRAALATSKSWVSVHSKIDLNVTNEIRNNH